jgi:hypothetical protein
MSWPYLIRRDSGLSLAPLLGGLLVVLACLAPTWFGGFLLDDALHLHVISGGAGARDLSCAIDPARLGLHLPGQVSPERFDYWRPLTGLSLLADHQLFGLKPLGYHLTSTLLHLASVLLAFRLGRRLGLDPKPARAAALVWGVSLPAGLAVGWISGRSELLAAVCVLGAHLAAARYAEGRSPGWLAGCLALLLAGTLAKESAAVGPALVGLFLLAARRVKAGGLSGSGPGLAVLALLWLPVGLGLGLRFWTAGAPGIPEPYFQPPDSAPALVNLALKFMIYLGGGLTGLPVIPFLEAGFLRDNWWAAALLAVLLVAGLRAVLRASGSGGRWLLAWFTVGLGPALLVMAFSFYLYLPLLGLCWLLGLAWQHSPRAGWWLAWLAASGILLNLALGTILIRLEQSQAEALDGLEAGLALTERPQVVLLDAPFWAYALPPAAKLHEPGRDFPAQFVNFSPTLVPGTPSRLTWTDGRRLEVARPRGTFFTAPIERFFLFGQDPCARQGAPATVAVTCQGGNPPRVLEVELGASAAGSGLLLFQFRGWQMHQILPPLPPRAAPAPQ